MRDERTWYPLCKRLRGCKLVVNLRSPRKVFETAGPPESSTDGRREGDRRFVASPVPREVCGEHHGDCRGEPPASTGEIDVLGVLRHSERCTHCCAARSAIQQGAVDCVA